MPPALTTPPFHIRAAFFGILLLGLTLRVWTIGYGIPHTVGVDEPEILQRAVIMMKSGDFNPHFFDYGGLTIYFHTAVASLRFAVGALGGRFASLEHVWVGDFLLWARMATALIGTLVIYIVFRVGLRWSTTVALVAALLTAVHPMLVQNAHFALTDTPLTFLVALTLLLSVIASTEQQLRWFIAAGLAAGLATAVKYNGALALLMPLAAVATTTGLPRRMACALTAMAASAVAFVAAAPYTVLDLPGFLNAFAYLARSYNQRRSAWEIADTYVKYLRNGFGFGLPWSHALGWPALMLSLAGFGIMAIRAQLADRRTLAIAALLFTVAYFRMLSQQSLVYGRYLLPLLPIVCLAAAVAVEWVLAAVQRAQRPALRRAAVAVLVLLAVAPTTQAFMFNWNRRGIGTEEMAARWLEKNVPQGELILSEAPTFRLPPGFKLDYQPRLIDHPLDHYRQLGARYLVASSERSATATPTPQGATAYQQLLSATQMVHVIPKTDKNPGPTLTVLRIP